MLVDDSLSRTNMKTKSNPLSGSPELSALRSDSTLLEQLLAAEGEMSADLTRSTPKKLLQQIRETGGNIREISIAAFSEAEALARLEKAIVTVSGAVAEVAKGLIETLGAPARLAIEGFISQEKAQKKEEFCEASAKLLSMTKPELEGLFLNTQQHRDFTRLNSVLELSYLNASADPAAILAAAKRLLALAAYIDKNETALGFQE